MKTFKIVRDGTRLIFCRAFVENRENRKTGGWKNLRFPCAHRTRDSREFETGARRTMRVTTVKSSPVRPRVVGVRSPRDHHVRRAAAGCCVYPPQPLFYLPTRALVLSFFTFWREGTGQDGPHRLFSSTDGRNLSFAAVSWRNIPCRTSQAAVEVEKMK